METLEGWRVGRSQVRQSGIPVENLGLRFGRVECWKRKERRERRYERKESRDETTRKGEEKRDKQEQRGEKRERETGENIRYQRKI